jgi:S-adenosylmethionine hydrolase
VRPIALLTDFGTRDWYVGVLHAVLEREAPGCVRMDISHAVEAGDIAQGGFFLECAWPWLPDACVVLAVVDPGVGAGRRAVAARVGRRWIVAPDNGLVAAPGPADEAWTIEWARLGTGVPSATFHGRDVFAPAAARLARGDGPETLGTMLDPGDLKIGPQVSDPARVIHVDRFGNCITGLRDADHPLSTRLGWNGGATVARVPSYGHANNGELITVAGSSAHLEIACVNGSAAVATGLRRGDRVSILEEES